jgi:hypothetical protein
MRLIVRWGVAISVSLGVFGLAWWVCHAVVGLDESETLAMAGAALTIALALVAWWAPRQPAAESGGGGIQVTQSVRARRDAYVAGRDQEVVIHRHPDE